MSEELIIIKQLPIIEEQLRNVRAEVESRVADALSLVCTEETYKEVKTARAALNKEYAALEARRKEVKAQVLAPYARFEDAYKENIGGLYEDADRKLGQKIREVENGLKAQKAEDLMRYFDEYRKSLHLDEDVAIFEKAHINITLNATTKSLRSAAKEYLDRVDGDLKLIDTQLDKEEILVEYRKTGNVSDAISTVFNRHKAIEAERERMEREKAEKEAIESAVASVEAAIPDTIEKESVIAPDIEITTPVIIESSEEAENHEEPTYNTAFRVYGTISMLKKLKAFLKEGGYNYEQL